MHGLGSYCDYMENGCGPQNITIYGDCEKTFLHNFEWIEKRKGKLGSNMLLHLRIEARMEDVALGLIT